MLRTFQNGDRVWSVVRNKAALTISSGKLGRKPRTEERRYGNDYVAEWNLRDLVPKRLREGYQETTPLGAMPSLTATGAALDRAVLDDPADLAAHMAFADWLSEQSDVKFQAYGEFIRVQLRLEDEGLSRADRRRLQKREKQLQEQHQHDWMDAPLARLLLEHDLAALPDYRRHEFGLFDWSFARGRLDRLVLKQLTVEIAQILAGSTALHCLRTLRVEDIDEGGDPFAVLGATDTLANLRELKLQMYTGTASPAPFLERPRHLRTLTLMDFTEPIAGLLSLPNLNSLRTLCLVAMDWPLPELENSTSLIALRTLRVNDEPDVPLYEENIGVVELTDVTRAVQSAHLDELSVLVVHSFFGGDEGCAELVRSGVIGRLEELDLSYGDLGDEGARHLLGCPDVARLKRLVLRRNHISRGMVQTLKGALSNVDVRGQQPR